MDNIYDVYAWSRRYREERLAAAGRVRLEAELQARRGTRPRWERIRSILAGSPALLLTAGGDEEAKTW